MNDTLPTEKPNLLIVEDSPTQAENLKILLEAHGYDFVACKDGESALERIAQSLPDLVVSDIVMPGIDGYELCRRIKSDSRARRVPVILLTSLSDPTDVIKGLEAGADNFIFKPFDDEYLLKRVEFALAHRALGDADVSRMGIEVAFAGRRFYITSDRLQILNLLLSTYEAAVQRNHELTRVRDELRALNENLEARVQKRTQQLADEIVERKRLADERAAALERVSLLARATNDAIWDWDIQSDALWWNRGLERLFGYDRGSVEPGIASVHSRIHPQDAPRVLMAVREAIDSGVEQWSDEFRFLKSDGSYAYVLERGHIIRDAGGTATRMVCGMTDLTDRKRAEEQLREQATLLDKARDAIVVLDLQRRILYWNSSAADLYGWSAEEAREREFQKLVCREQGLFVEAFVETIQSGEWSGELEHHAKDGRKLHIQSRLTLVRDDLGQPKSVLAINTDMTERKLLEEQFLRAQRLESIGTLAGGVAHDLNNLLSPIMMSVDLLKKLGASPQAESIIENIGRSARRGTELVKQILSFARGVPGNRASLSIDQIAQEVESITRKTFPKNIEFERSAEEGLWLVEADPTQLNQVALNLCVNARDAMPDGGRLAVRSRNVEIGESRDAKDGGLEPGRYVLLEVSDQGCGMSKETIDRIFDPFFTTKEIGKGTGLGLSTVLGIARSHRGRIEVESEPGHGATFRLYLPAKPADEAALEAPPAAATPQSGSSQTILVVDDEAAILDITKQTLEAFDYKVITADDGAEAIALYSMRREEIDAVITDMMMPTMDGPALIAALRRVDPDIPIIAVTGLYANSPQVAQLDANLVLTKPYTANALLTAVAAALEGARSNSADPASPL